MAEDRDPPSPPAPDAPQADPARSDTAHGVGPGGADAPGGAAKGEGIGDSATIEAPGGITPATPAGPPVEVRTGQGELPRVATLVGQTLAGRYAVLELIGRGGMSVVYRARHELLKKIVAIKVLREALATNKESLTRFHREAMAAASIGDPHIVDITDYGFTERGDAFIVMEALEGSNLRQIVAAEGALEVGRCVAITRQILRALTAAHGRGIIHRDLKAENVFITRREGRDFVKLLDFGISKVLQPPEGEDETGLTSTGQVMGTPQYLAPEQAQGVEKVDHRVDIYAMGVILYEMLTGELPFTGKSVFDLVMKHVQEPPQPPSQRRPDLRIPAELEQVVLRALAKKPEERYASAEAMLAALPSSDALPGGFPSGTLPDGLGPIVAPARERKARRGAINLILIGAALLVLGGLLLRHYFAGTAGDPASDAGLRGAAPAGDVLQLPRRDAVAASANAATEDGAPGKPDAAAASVRVTIRVRPATASVYLDDRLLGRGDQQLTLAPDDVDHSLLVQAPGYAPRAQTFRASKVRSLTLTLVRRPAGKPGKPGKTKDPGKTKGGSDIDSNPYKQ